MRWLVVASIVLAACPGPGPQRVGAPPSWRGAGADPATATGATPAAIAPPSRVRFAPAGAAVARYNEPPPPAPRSELGDAVTAAVRAAALSAGLPVPVPDARLFRACAELAAIVPDETVAGGTLDNAVIEFALQRNGIIDPEPRLLFGWGDVSSPDRVVENLRPSFESFLRDRPTARLGIGVAQHRADGTAAIVFALQGSWVSTRPIPRAVAAGARVPIDAVVDPRFRDPELFVTQEGGATQQLEVKSGRPGGFVAQVECGARQGRRQIEITASDASGSTVLANFPVWCGAEPPLSITVDTAHRDVPDSADAAERLLLTSVNRDRAAAGLPALVWDRAVAAVARGYSEEMRRTHLVAHISPTSGAASDRVRAAGIRTRVVLENVARAYGIAEAHQALMNSPGHRTNLMSPLATHIGIGVAFGDTASRRRELFITQVFIRVQPAFDRGQAVAAIRRKLAAARQVPATAALDRLAQQLADGVAAGKSADTAYQAISAQVTGMGKQYQSVGRMVTAVADLDAIEGPELLGKAAADELGLGLAQGPHPEIGDDAIWIVVLLAHRRTP